MDYDRALISSIVNARQESYFHTSPGWDNGWDDVWDFVIETYNAKGAPPSVEKLEAEFDAPFRTYPDEITLLLRRLQRMSVGPMYAYNTWSEAHIPLEYLGEQSRLVMGFIQKHVADHGQVPTADIIAQEFPQVKLKDEPPAVTWVMEKIRHRYLFALAKRSLRDAFDKLEDRNVEECWELLRNATIEAEHDLRPMEDINLADMAAVEKRIKEYEDRKAAGGINGIEYWLPRLTKATLGKTAGQLIGFIARQGVGKTWAEVIDAHHTWNLGFTPMLVTKEMGVWEIIGRWDAAYAKVPHATLRAAQLGAHVEKSFFQSLRSLPNFHPFWVIGDDGGTATVSSISAKVAEYRPDILYVDGAYLIDDELNAEKQYQRVTNVVRALKRLARRHNIPVVITLQFNREGAKRGDSADDTNIGDADVAKEFDVLVYLYQDTDLREMKRMKYKLGKQREGERIEGFYNNNFDTMDFTEVIDEEIGDEPTERTDLDNDTEF